MRYMICILTLSPLITYMIHALLIRASRLKPLQLTAVVSVLLGNIPIIFLCIFYMLNTKLIFIEKLGIIIYSIIVYNVLGYVYFHIFNMSETARRIRILIELKKFGMLKKDDILKQYNPKYIVDTRLNRLLDLKQLKIENNKYQINRRFLLMVAKMYNVWRDLLRYNKKYLYA